MSNSVKLHTAKKYIEMGIGRKLTAAELKELGADMERERQKKLKK